MHKVFPANIDKLYDMLNSIRIECYEAGLEPSYILKIELAAEEALVNIIQYGYPGQKGNIEIECLIDHDLGLKIIIKDQGLSYNPLKKPMKDDPHSTEDPGGYGIFFIRKLMDEVGYRRENNLNVLTLFKRIPRIS